MTLECFSVGALLPWNLVELWTAALTTVATGVTLALTLQLLQDTNQHTNSHAVCLQSSS